MDLLEKAQVWIVSGPTGSGKTDFAEDWARRTGALIANVDPYQFYREIPILSNLPTFMPKKPLF